MDTLLIHNIQNNILNIEKKIIKFYRFENNHVHNQAVAKMKLLYIRRIWAEYNISSEINKHLILLLTLTISESKLSVSMRIERFSNQISICTFPDLGQLIN